MKKASKVFLIIGGIFAILFSLYFLFLIGVEMLGGFAAGITGIVYMAMGFVAKTEEEMASMFTSGVIVIGYGLVAVVVATIVFSIAFFMNLLSGIFGLIATKRKKGLNIASIIITALTIGIVLMMSPTALLLALYMLLLWFVFIILAFTPVTWIYLGVIVLVIIGWLAIIFIILGNIFSLISIAKDKNDEEVAEFGPEVEVVE